MIVALCLGLLSCRQTAPRQDVLEVIFPTGTEGFVEVTFGAEGERCDTLPIVDGRLLMEKDSLPVTVTLKYLKERDADDKVWLAVQGAHARWGSIPLGYGRTEVTFDSLTPQVSVGRIADEYGDFEANDVFFNAPQHFRSQDFLKAHSESVQALHLLSKSWDVVAQLRQRTRTAATHFGSQRAGWGGKAFPHVGHGRESPYFRGVSGWEGVYAAEPVGELVRPLSCRDTRTDSIRGRMS